MAVADPNVSIYTDISPNKKMLLLSPHKSLTSLQRVILPVTLGVLALAMFIFICWWFPRAWSKGQAKQNKEWDEINRQRREREEAEASTDVELGDTAGNPVNADASKTTAQPRTTTYVPPVTAY